MPLAISWSHCPSDPLLWLQVRDFLLQLLYKVWFVLPLVGTLTWWCARPLNTFARFATMFFTMFLVCLLYSPIGTFALTAWLHRQIPQTVTPTPSQSDLAVVVVLGRGPQVATATTAVATSLMRTGRAHAIYVSGDEFTTAKSLVRQGVPSDQIAGDSCARTTWDNATVTTAWLQRHFPSSFVLLVTDPWHLPRATAVFRRQGLAVEPIPAVPELSPSERNRFALRETAGTVLYGLQARL